MMDPAPGYDDKMPHDLAHFIVENEFGIEGGLFGQLAAGGFAGTFRPMEGRKKTGRVARASDRISAKSKDDAALSEKLVGVVSSIWSGSEYKPEQPKGFSEENIRRVGERFEEISARWGSLAVGESITLEWNGKRARRRGQPPRRGDVEFKRGENY